MNTPMPDISRWDQDDKLQLLELLLNDLSRQGTISRATLMTIGADVMAFDYKNDEDLLCFHCIGHEMHDE